MTGTALHRSRMIVGWILVLAAVLMLLFTSGGYSTAGVIAIAVLGLLSIAISRRKDRDSMHGRTI